MASSYYVSTEPTVIRAWSMAFCEVSPGLFQPGEMCTLIKVKLSHRPTMDAYYATDCRGSFVIVFCRVALMSRIVYLFGGEGSFIRSLENGFIAACLEFFSRVLGTVEIKHVLLFLV